MQSRKFQHRLPHISNSFGRGESESLSVLSNSATSWTIQSMEFSRLEYWSGQPFHSLGDLPNPGIESRYPSLQADSLPAEPQGKPKNTRVGSLSLLQRIFPTWESNRGLLHCRWILLHCRWILYQLNYVQFSLSVVSDSLRPRESQHARPPCPSQTPGVYSSSCPSSW